MPSPLGEKIRAARKKKRLSLDQLGVLTSSSKGYLWGLENRDDPKPSVDKISKIAAALEVTPDFLISHSGTTPDEDVIDEAFFRKYKRMPEETKRRLRQILDAWDDE
ncbi:Helix-turn-helix transcriptional regulator [Gammaproteobacteria bacterium]